MGGSEAKQKFLYLKSTAKFGPLDKFHFFLRKNFLMWVGGWVGQPKSRGGPPTVSLSKALDGSPPPPPHTGSNRLLASSDGADNPTATASTVSWRVNHVIRGGAA